MHSIKGVTSAKHQGTYLRHFCRGLSIPSFLALISCNLAVVNTLTGYLKTNQTGTDMLELVHSFVLAFPLLLTLHAREEVPPATDDNHQLTRYVTNNPFAKQFYPFCVFIIFVLLRQAINKSASCVSFSMIFCICSIFVVSTHFIILIILFCIC